MRRITFALFICGFTCFLNTANSQETPTAKDKEPTGPIVELPSDVSVTPEMWMYLHEYQSNKDPKQAIRKRAEFRAKQRRARLAAQRWYGHSPLRPTANSLPQMSPSHGSTWIGVPWSPTEWTAYTTKHRSSYYGSHREYGIPSLRLARQR